MKQYYTHDYLIIAILGIAVFSSVKIPTETIEHTRPIVHETIDTPHIEITLPDEEVLDFDMTVIPIPVVKAKLSAIQEAKHVNYYKQQPYKTDREFVEYWLKNDGVKPFVDQFHLPAQIILAKQWKETWGGLAGAGKRGALYGIKGSGIKGYDDVDRENVEYQAYGERWEALSHFCRLLTGDSTLTRRGVHSQMYIQRYRAWKRVHPDKPSWYNWALAMQVHPQLKYSYYAYAAEGCKDGTQKYCYNKRKKHAQSVISIIERNRDIFEKYGYWDEPETLY